MIHRRRHMLTILATLHSLSLLLIRIAVLLMLRTHRRFHITSVEHPQHLLRFQPPSYLLNGLTIPSVPRIMWREHRTMPGLMTSLENRLSNCLLRRKTEVKELRLAKNNISLP
ncbi:hypothetical protein F5890DRAFT_1548448 [Lentinula detonsa]|uniref:Uncharacterized protein n=1 Tax=Lentinula detonsa TaxID=2804962 RepID=A0AA38PMS9_9AGAR|nr:hypothetical protein F5890DRAFT_1548448 [Lentinula detonsa]